MFALYLCLALLACNPLGKHFVSNWQHNAGQCDTILQFEQNALFSFVNNAEAATEKTVKSGSCNEVLSVQYHVFLLQKIKYGWRSPES